MILLLQILFAAPFAAAYKFSLAADPTQCGNFTVHWEGGRGPFELLLVPVGHVTPEVRTIVDQRVDSGNSISLQLKFPKDSEFIASLSDGSGVGAGGTSDVLRVRDGPDDCLTNPVQAPWVLYMDGTPNQCQATRISWDASARAPVSMWGVIPGGATFDMGAPSSGTGWDWTPNVPSGTRMLIVAGDSRGRGTGGSSDLFTIGGGGSGCLQDDSPRTTDGPAAGQVAPTSTSSSGSEPTSSSGDNSGHGNSGSGNGGDGGSNSGHGNGSNGGNGDNHPSGNGSGDGDNSANASPQDNPDGATSTSPSGATIAGIVLGTLAAVFLAILGLFFCLRARRRHQRQSSSDGITTMRGRGDLLASNAPSIAGSTGVDSLFTHAPHENIPRGYETTPFVIRPRGGARESGDAIPGVAGVPLLRAHSGYSADLSDLESSHDHSRSMHGHRSTAPTTEDGFTNARLLVPSPLETPSQEKAAYLDPFSDRAAAAVIEPERSQSSVPSNSPPSFKTVATGGHARQRSARSQRSQRTTSEAETESTSSVHHFPSVRQSGAPLTLLPHEAISTLTLGDTDVPPSYDSWRKSPNGNRRNADGVVMASPFGDEKASSSSHS